MPNDNALINWGHLVRFASNLKDKFDEIQVSDIKDTIVDITEEYSRNVFFVNDYSGNGITITTNNAGELIVNGTSTKDIKIPIMGKSTPYETNLKSGTYGFRCYSVSGTATDIQGFSLRSNASESSIGTYVCNPNGYKNRLVFNSDTAVFIYISTGKTFTNFTLRVQIEKGEASSQFEKGGKTAVDLVARQKPSPLKCKWMEDYGTTINISDCSITPNNITVLDSNEVKFSQKSKALKVVKINGATTYSVNINLPQPVYTNSLILTTKITKETLDPSKGCYFSAKINDGTAELSRSNGLSNYNTWCYLGMKTTNKEWVSKIRLEFTIRGSVNVGDVCGLIYLDSITYNAKMKPTFILNFDQWWQESVDNGGYDYCFSNGIPFTMMTKNYDNLSQQWKELAHKAESEYGCENAYYASYGSNNNSLLDAASYNTAVSEVNNIKNDYINEFKHGCVSFGCTQMKMKDYDRIALLDGGFKMIRGYNSNVDIDYFDEDCYWTPSYEIGSSEHTYEKVIGKINNVVKYGGLMLAFTHGINTDGEDYMADSTSTGMNITDFKNMIDYLVELRNQGKITICTMEQWYNLCCK